MGSKAEYLLVIAVFLGFVGIVSKGLAVAQPGDENVYYYMGKLVAEGSVPYRDFFYAHPPLQLYSIAVVFKVFGFNIIALKLVPFMSTLITAFFTYLMTRNLFGRREAVISLLLFLFSYSAMFNSVFSFGISLAAMFLMIGLYFHSVRNKPFLAGVFFGIAGSVRLLALVPIVVLLIFSFIKSRRNFPRLLLGFSIIFIAVNLIFILFFGTRYIFPVYKFHFLKDAGHGAGFSEYYNVVRLNYILFAGFIVSAFIKKESKLRPFIAISLAYLIMLAFLARIFNFYFIIVFPFLAITGGYSINSVLNSLRSSSKKYYLTALLIISIIFIANLISDSIFLHKISFVGFSRGGDIKNFIISNSKPATMLFGDASAAPLVALMSHRKIALDFVDTNPAVFETGMKDLGSTLNALNRSDVIFVGRSTEGITELPEARDFLNNECSLLSTFNDKIEGMYLLYRCGR